MTLLNINSGGENLNFINLKLFQSLSHFMDLLVVISVVLVIMVSFIIISGFMMLRTGPCQKLFLADDNGGHYYVMFDSSIYICFVN